MPFFTCFSASRWLLVGLSCAVLSFGGMASCSPVASESPTVEEPQSDVPASVPDRDRPTEESNMFTLGGQVLPVTAEMVLGSKTLGLEVARTPQQQAIGLMYRETLPDDRGMLFPFSPARPVSFWMKNVAIPLDMVFIYQERIVAIEENVPPCGSDPCPTYGPGSQPVDYVLEVRGGLAQELNLQPGDRAIVEWLTESSPTSPSQF